MTLASMQSAWRQRRSERRAMKKKAPEGQTRGFQCEDKGQGEASAAPPRRIGSIRPRPVAGSLKLVDP
jgi:hypothetical protein